MPHKFVLKQVNGFKEKAKLDRNSFRYGFSFGLTSAIITTLGLIVGLHSSTHSGIAVIGGILTIAVADSMSDAMGVHISRESENKHSEKEIWEATFSTFLSKFLFALTFIAPVLFLDLETAILASIIWGLSLLGIFSYYLAKKQERNPIKVVGEHLLIAGIVIIITHYTGNYIGTVFV